MQNPWNFKYYTQSTINLRLPDIFASLKMPAERAAQNGNLRRTSIRQKQCLRYEFILYAPHFPMSNPHVSECSKLPHLAGHK